MGFDRFTDEMAGYADAIAAEAERPETKPSTVKVRFEEDVALLAFYEITSVVHPKIFKKGDTLEVSYIWSPPAEPDSLLDPDRKVLIVAKRKIGGVDFHWSAWLKKRQMTGVHDEANTETN